MVNVFPMDLIGPKGVRHFPLVLHCTSAAVPLMERWRQDRLKQCASRSGLSGLRARQEPRNAMHRCRSTADCHCTVHRLRVPGATFESGRCASKPFAPRGSHKLFLAVTRHDQRQADRLRCFLCTDSIKPGGTERTDDSVAFARAEFGKVELQRTGPPPQRQEMVPTSHGRLDVSAGRPEKHQGAASTPELSVANPFLKDAKRSMPVSR